MAELGHAHCMAVDLESHDVLVQRAMVQRAVGGAVTLGSLVIIGLGAFEGSTASMISWIMTGLVGLLVGPMIMASAGRDPDSRSGRAGVLLLDDGVLEITGAQRRIHVSDIEAGWIEEDFVGGTLVLETKTGITVAARFRDGQRERAESMLRALGVDARLVVMRLAASERAGRGCAGGCLTVTALFGVIPAVFLLAGTINSLVTGTAHSGLVLMTAFFVLTCTLAVVVSVNALLTTTVRIGADGVHVGRRFIAYGDLDEVRHVANGVSFEASGRKHKVRCLGVQAATVIRNVETALARFRQAQDGSELDLELLDRRERPVSEWRQAVARVMDRLSYRNRALDRDELLAVAENPRAPRDRRAGAILAILPDASDEEISRLRIASDTCAEPHTRAAMEAAMHEELEALEEALQKAPPQRA